MLAAAEMALLSRCARTWCVELHKREAGLWPLGALPQGAKPAAARPEGGQGSHEARVHTWQGSDVPSTLGSWREAAGRLQASAGRKEAGCAQGRCGAAWHSVSRPRPRTCCNHTT